MSVVSFTSNKQNVQDLLASLPAPATQVERTRSGDLSQESRPGFNDLLRDSSETQQAPQRAESPEPVDAQPRAESQQTDQSGAESSEQVDQESATSESAEDSSQKDTEGTESAQSENTADDANADGQPKDTSGEAQVQAAANAASAQLNVLDAVVKDPSATQSKVTTNQQLGVEVAAKAVTSDKASDAKQSTGANLSLNAALPNQTQSTTGSAAQADTAAAVQPLLQQGDASQTNSGDARGDSKSASTPTTSAASASTSSNSAAATAFAVPDQASGDARLPISTTATTPVVDAGKQVQVQAAVNTADNDSLNTARLTRGLANAVQQRGGAVTLRLTPPEMGTVRIQMQISGTSVSASFHAESSSAQTLLTTQLAQLRTALESKGMSVDRLSVQPLASTASSQNANQSQNQGDTQQQGQSQQQSAGDGRSRGQYSGDSSRQQPSDPQQGNGNNQQAPRGFFDRLNDASEEQAA